MSEVQEFDPPRRRNLAQSIADSLAIAAQQVADHQARRAAILDAYPDGYAFKIGRSRYEKQTIAGDTFWVGPKRGYTSRQFGVELGTLLDSDVHYSFACWHAKQDKALD